MSPLRVRGLAFGLLALAAVAGLATPARQAGASVVPAPRACLLPDASPDGRDAPVPGTDGTLAGGKTLRPYVSARIASVGCRWSDDVRAIVVDREEIRLQMAGRVVREIRRTGTDSGAIELHALVELIGDPDWIRREGRTVTVGAAIVQNSGTVLSVGSEMVREVRLLDRPYVGIIGRGATASFEGVTVVSWSVAADGPVVGHGRTRPFVHYDADSRMDITDSVFAWLGSAASGATGVTWSGLSGGTVVSTAFSNNYIGVTASEPEQLVFMFNTMRDNVADGLRVTSGDHGPTVDTNTMQGNGLDGVALAGVSGSVVRNNHVWGNSRHGVVLGAGAVGTAVLGNVIEPNGVDGVVLEGATDNRVVGNVIGAHRSGIRLDGSATTGNVISRNLISDSPIGVQISTSPGENSVAENEISRAAIAKILTPVSSALSTAEIPSVGESAPAVASSDSERQLLFGVGLLGAFVAVCAVGTEFARRLVSRPRTEESIDLDRRVGLAGKANYARTSDH